MRHLLPSCLLLLSLTSCQSVKQDVESRTVRTGLDAHTLLTQAIQAAPITSTLDGRSGDN